MEKWLSDNSAKFKKLSKKRLEAGEEYRENVIRNNMIELIDILTAQPDFLPSQAAERISLQRLKAKESELTTKDIMIAIPMIDSSSTIQDAAKSMIDNNSGIIAVISNEKLVGVVTDWDITKASAGGSCDGIVTEIMTKQVITASPDFNILDIVREFEQYQISAMPVVQEGKVLGKISSDLIAQRYILNFLQDTKSR